MIDAERIKALSSEKKYDEAISLLLEWVEETEREDKVNRCGVAPYPYNELAKIYTNLKTPELAKGILERYFGQRMARGRQKDKMAERYEQLCEKHGYVIPVDVGVVLKMIKSGTMDDIILKTALSRYKP